MNIIRAMRAFLSFTPFLHIRYADMPIKKKSEVQTGPKTELGGLNDGLLKAAYQMGMDGAVKSEPMKPASWQIARQIISFKISTEFTLSITNPNIEKS